MSVFVGFEKYHSFLSSNTKYSQALKEERKFRTYIRRVIKDNSQEVLMSYFHEKYRGYVLIENRVGNDIALCITNILMRTVNSL